MEAGLQTLSRRRLLGSLAASAAIIGSGAIAAPALARDDHLLPFRKGASILPLNFNENSLGMSPAAKDAAAFAVKNKGNRYADASIADLRNMLATSNGVPTDQILLGNGSTDVIKAVVATAAQVKATVIEPDPTFGDVRRYARSYGLQLVQVPVGAGFVTDIAALRARAEATNGPLLINICNPNNPTGTIVDQAALMDWINAAPDGHLFLIDEAYFDYAKNSVGYSSLIGEIRRGRENIVVARTFSKVYGMAGMRVGFGVAAPETAKRIRPFAANYNMSATGLAAAIASLKDEAFYAKSLASNQTAKNILLETLADLGLAHIPAHTNFVLHRIGSDLDIYKKRMAENGVLVGRRMTAEDGWNRLSIGTPSEMQEFARTLRAFRDKGWV